MCKQVRQPEISKRLWGGTFCRLKTVWLRKIEISDKGGASFDVMDYSYLVDEINQETNF